MREHLEQANAHVELFAKISFPHMTNRAQTCLFKYDSNRNMFIL